MPERVLLDVDEPRDGPLVEEAVRRRDEAEGRRDYLVPLADLQRSHAQVEPGRPAGAGDAFAAAGEGGDARLEPRRERTNRQHVTGEDLDTSSSSRAPMSGRARETLSLSGGRGRLIWCSASGGAIRSNVHGRGCAGAASGLRRTIA